MNPTGVLSVPLWSGDPRSAASGGTSRCSRSPRCSRMSVWFSASAVVPQLTAEWKLSGALQSWLTTSVQLGFVAGALLSSLLTLSDRLPAQRLLAVSALAAAAFNAAIPLLDLGSRPGARLPLPHRLRARRRLSARHEAGGLLVPGGPRPRHRPAGGRHHPGHGGAALPQRRARRHAALAERCCC